MSQGADATRQDEVVDSAAEGHFARIGVHGKLENQSIHTNLIRILKSKNTHGCERISLAHMCLCVTLLILITMRIYGLMIFMPHVAPPSLSCSQLTRSRHRLTSSAFNCGTLTIAFASRTASLSCVCECVCVSLTLRADAAEGGGKRR